MAGARLREAGWEAQAKGITIVRNSYNDLDGAIASHKGKRGRSAATHVQERPLLNKVSCELVADLAGEARRMVSSTIYF